jgi:integrase
MAKKKTPSRLYTRNQGGRSRYYADLRGYEDVITERTAGGNAKTHVALIPPGQKRATDDPDVAAKLLADQLAELERKRRVLQMEGPAALEQVIADEARPRLARYAEHHLRQKSRDDEVTYRWLLQAERHLKAAVAFFGADADLTAVTPKELTRWVNHLRTVDNRRGGKLSEGSVRKYLNSLSNLYARAVSEEHAIRNPVAAMYTKPTEERREARFLEAHEAALLLESARTFRPRVDDGAFPWPYPLLATFLLTGGRKSEVLGLELEDVSLTHGKVYFRPNRWRRMKTRGSERSVPLFPQLEEILRAYLIEREAAGGIEGTLLFPSTRAGEERPLHDVRKLLDAIAVRAGFQKGQVRLHGLRHTFTAARIQTCDRGRPVSLYTVARELGHRGTDMIEDRYGHLHDRAQEGCPEVVEFRVDSHREHLGERLSALEKRAAREAADA